MKSIGTRNTFYRYFIFFFFFSLRLDASSPSSICRAEEATCRQRQVGDTDCIKCIREHCCTPPIRHRVARITDSEENDNAGDSCTCVDGSCEHILFSISSFVQEFKQDTRQSYVILCPPGKEVLFDVTIEDPVYQGPGGVVDSRSRWDIVLDIISVLQPLLAFITHRAHKEQRPIHILENLLSRLLVCVPSDHGRQSTNPEEM